MLIGGHDISYDVVTLGTCFSMFVYIRATGGNQTVQLTGSHRELEVEFKFQRHSCIIYSPSFSPVNLHRSKPLISLVPFNLHFLCFQGSGHCYVTIPVVFPANQKQSFK